jgi:dipeptidyl aminopeptidase/acylaminoacyl peptidase
VRILVEHRNLARIPVSFVGAILAGMIVSNALAEDTSRRHFQPGDIHLLKNVGDIAVSPDGEWAAYRVGVTDVGKDTNPADLFMVSWDGKNRIQLTHTKKESESHPRFSPDGHYLAFITERSDGESDEDDDPGNKSQVWLLNRAGGEAERVTELAGGVSGFEWSPDSSRLVLVSRDPEKKAEDEDESEEKTHDTPKPIVIDRYQFKSDSQGYLERRYERLYIFDIETREAALLTEGAYDSSEPVWNPAGDLIAFSSRREGDPDRHGNSDIYVVEPREGATARQLTMHKGADYSPAFSPNGKQIAYLQGSSSKYYDYDPAQLAVMSVAGGEPFLPAGELDRNVASPRWSADGRSLFFLVADDRTRTLRRVSAKGGKIKQVYPAKNLPGVVRSFEVGKKGVVAVVSFGQQPAELYRSSDGRALSDHNRELLEQIEWATVEGFDSTGKDGEKLGAMLLKPPGFRDGVAYPTIAYVHGGPVAQDGYEFDVTSQILAAQGYLVVNPNYRGSSGRGKAFSRAIYADWGNLEIQDIHAIMDQLVEEGLADPERLGIGGWSYGGMNTNYAIATDTRFKAAVSGAAISNMITGYGTDQYVQQYENELGLPWESIDTYLRLSYPFFHADRIKTPTLFMCGEKDFNVPLINSEQMYQALRSMNVPTKLIIYPGQHHGLAKPSYLQDRLERMIDWYGKYLILD